MELHQQLNDHGKPVEQNIYNVLRSDWKKTYPAIACLLHDDWWRIQILCQRKFQSALSGLQDITETHITFCHGVLAEQSKWLKAALNLLDKNTLSDADFISWYVY